MAVSSKEIKRRIKSVKNIGQITKAMELVAASKMRKAQVQATSSRPYSTASSELLSSLSKMVDAGLHPLINRPKPEGKLDFKPKNLAIILTSDKGLAGSFNTNIITKTVSFLKTENELEFDFITVGKKGADAVRRLGHNIIAAFPSKDRNISILDAKPLSKIIIEDFLKWKYDQVYIIYTDFISVLVQKPNVMRVLPVKQHSDEVGDEYLFEPSPQKVFDHLVYRALEFEVFQCLLETAASEHSARMVAMKNAHQASMDVIDDLTLYANQARQAGITRELSEITAAKLAMES
jgi:F-type H+-transporting ATPase subunit gamma